MVVMLPRIFVRISSAALAIAIMAAVTMAETKAKEDTNTKAAPQESEAASDKPFFEMKDLFGAKRIPKIIVARDGTVLAFTGSCGVYRRSTDSGRTWDEARAPAPKAGGNAIVDQTTGDILIFKTRSGDVWRSRDRGKTWKQEKATIRPNLAGHGPPDGMRASANCSESGITLQYGKHKGRLLMPVRITPPKNSNAQETWWYHYNTAIYSDDGGRTWQTSEPIQSGTGEGTLAELSDGRIYYNSRSHLSVDHRRQISWSHNGGRYFVDWSASDRLFEVGQPFYFKHGSKPSYGCNAGLVRMPSRCVKEKDVLLFSQPDDPGGHRFKMTVHASFDGAKTWPIKKLVFKGPCAYSSMAAGPDGMIYVLFERGDIGKRNPYRHIALARFNMAWLRENATKQQPAEKKKPAKVDAKTREAVGASAKPFFEMKDLFDKIRVPTIVTAKDGTILAFASCCGRYRRSEDSGKTWSDVIALASGVGGGVVVDDVTGEVLIVSHSGYVWRSRDHGRTWAKREKVVIRPNPAGHGDPAGITTSIDSMESGITLTFGKHKGRLILPTRVRPVGGGKDQFWWYDYNTAIYSDDRGKTWQVGGPVQTGTGEGTLAQLSDGRIYYNSRSHMAVDHRRQIAWSHNGGQYFVDWSASDDLREIGQPACFKHGTRPGYGCSAGLVRMPSQCVKEKDVLLFSQPDNPGGHRRRMTVYASLDGAKTWPVKRLIFEGASAYSSMTAGPDGTIYVLFERGPKGSNPYQKIALARFNMAWVLDEQR